MTEQQIVGMRARACNMPRLEAKGKEWVSGWETMNTSIEMLLKNAEAMRDGIRALKAQKEVGRAVDAYTNNVGFRR